MEMKKILECLLTFAIVFGVIFIVKLFIDKDNSKVNSYTKNKNVESDKKIDLKVDEELYFINGNTELTLYTSGYYFMYEEGNVNSGTFEILDNSIIFTQTKLYNDTCYDLLTYVYSKPIEIIDNKIYSVTISDSKLYATNEESLVNTKNTLLYNNIECYNKEENVVINNSSNNTSNNNNSNSNTSNNNGKDNDKINNEPLTWKIVSNHGICSQNLTKVYENNKYEYYVADPCVADYTYVEYSNGEKYTIREALNNGKITIEDLVQQKFTITIKTKNQNMENEWNIISEHGKCIQNITKVYEDSKYEYYAPNPCVADLTYIEFKNGDRYTVREALNKGKVTPNDLAKRDLYLSKKEKQTEPTPQPLTWSVVSNYGSCVQTVTKVYEDSKYNYYVSNPCIANLTYIEYSNGERYTVSEVLTNKKLTVDQLINKGINITKSSKISTQDEYSCPKGGSLTKDSSLGYICYKGSDYSKTVEYDFKCKATTYTWNCPGKSSSSIEDPSVGCYADALVSSFNACSKAGCMIRDIQPSDSSERYYTKEQMDETSNTYQLICKKEHYVETTYYCNGDWTNIPGSESLCYIPATKK